MTDPRPVVALVAHGIHDHGGMERAFNELILRTHDRFHYVVLAAELAPPLRPLVEWQRIRVPMRPIPLKLVAFAAVAGVRLLRTRPALVHTLGAIVPNRVDIATIQHCHAGAREAMGRLAPADSPAVRRLNTVLKRVIALALERWCYRPGRLRAFAAVSRGVARELERHYPGIPIALTPNGVDVERFRPDGNTRRATREELGAADGDFLLLFVGGDWHHKGLDVAIEGLAEARARGLGRARLVVVGRGDEAAFGARARALGLDGAVRFVGVRRDAERLYGAADAFVLPSLYETFSLVAYEAAASALPVVATNVSAMDELVGDGGGGVLVERSPAAVAEVVLRLAGDAELRRRLGDSGRRRAAGYGWGRSTQAVLELYERLLEEGP